MSECSLKIGDLVVDNDPYKAPELYKGHGVVTEIIDSEHVVVYWPKYNSLAPAKVLFLYKVSENKT